MDDAALMSTFDLSTKGLNALFKELVSSGIIDRSELEDRVLLSCGSVAIDIDKATLPAGQAKKPRIDAADALFCIQGGMEDAELMKRYNLSIKGVQSLFGKLVAARLITRSELDLRSSTGQRSFVLDEQVRRPMTPFVASPDIELSAALELIRSGTSREGMAERYALSNAGLDHLIRRLVAEGLITKEEVDERLPAPVKEFEIRHRLSKEVMYRATATTLAVVVEKAVAAGADLANSELTGSNLARTNLCGARLSGADLQRANLSLADLTGARLNDATLKSAVMSGAVLYKANLARADLSEANLSMVYAAWSFLDSANLSEADLSYANLSGANLAKACLFETNLSGADLTGAYLSETVLTDKDWKPSRMG